MTDTGTLTYFCASPSLAVGLWGSTASQEWRGRHSARHGALSCAEAFLPQCPASPTRLQTVGTSWLKKWIREDSETHQPPPEGPAPDCHHFRRLQRVSAFGQPFPFCILDDGCGFLSFEIFVAFEIVVFWDFDLSGRKMGILELRERRVIFLS